MSALINALCEEGTREELCEHLRRLYTELQTIEEKLSNYCLCPRPLLEETLRCAYDDCWAVQAEFGVAAQPQENRIKQLMAIAGI